MSDGKLADPPSLGRAVDSSGVLRAIPGPLTAIVRTDSSESAKRSRPLPEPASIDTDSCSDTDTDEDGTESEKERRRRRRRRRRQSTAPSSKRLPRHGTTGGGPGGARGLGGMDVVWPFAGFGGWSAVVPGLRRGGLPDRGLCPSGIPPAALQCL